MTQTEKQKQYSKKWREEHKEEMSQYKKEYHQKNKDKIKERRSKKYDCACGGKYTGWHKATHEKTKQHQNYLSKNKL